MRFRHGWTGGDAAPATGMALSPAFLMRTTEVVGEDEIHLPLLAEQLPAETPVAAGALGKLDGELPAVLERILLASRAVVLITTPLGTGTGFMIAPRLVMTNNHVLVGPANARTATAGDARAQVRFNFHQDNNGKLAAWEEFATAPDVFFTADRELDFAIVGVQDDPGREWGAISLPDPAATVEEGDDVFIIQHPEGGPKQIVMAGNEVVYADDAVIQYTTDTLPGASGSPVFDWQWRLVALHHAGGDLVEPRTGDYYWRNEGVRIDAIQARLTATGIGLGPAGDS